jgi:hypothetical protein
VAVNVRGDGDGSNCSNMGDRDPLESAKVCMHVCVWVRNHVAHVGGMIGWQPLWGSKEVETAWLCSCLCSGTLQQYIVLAFCKAMLCTWEWLAWLLPLVMTLCMLCAPLLCSTCRQVSDVAAEGDALAGGWGAQRAVLFSGLRCAEQ